MDHHQPNPPPNHYTTLSLSPSLFTSNLPPQEIKQTLKKSYRRALLAHHPDKSSTTPATAQNSPPSISIDQITLAYTTLSTPSLRQAYDLFLLSSSSDSAPSGLGKHKLQPGIETIDLDDLVHQETEQGEEDEWYQPCRCGNPRGFLLRESDLEEAAESGIEEVVVGCADCSLWLRVVFGVVVAQEGEVQEGEKEENGGRG
ncbi:putative diphthamide biosynthesis protein 4 [Cercophora samala]|uniref:Diphthamide biosynthesis protein 4 n=1 Tax=Cercophora samala TaxID=330535 RepID=A0AA39YV46_9PEZI|nr:putative diphthamide biosynthesis protein 4 [Cercophora samala]